jgi:hypothetical protein
MKFLGNFAIFRQVLQNFGAMVNPPWLSISWIDGYVLTYEDNPILHVHSSFLFIAVGPRAV